MRFYTSPGYEHKINFSAVYSVNADEERAWDILEEILSSQRDESFEYEIYKTLETDPIVKIRVDFKVNLISRDADEALDDAVDLLEGIELPSGVTLEDLEQTSLVTVGERIVIAHGEDV